MSAPSKRPYTPVSIPTDALASTFVGATSDKAVKNTCKAAVPLWRKTATYLFSLGSCRGPAAGTRQPYIEENYHAKRSNVLA